MVRLQLQHRRQMLLRIFFGRFEKLNPSGIEVYPHPAWVWSNHGVANTHLPECFPCIHFSEAFVEDLAP